MFADMHLAEQLVDDLLLMIAVRTVRKPYGRFYNQARVLFQCSGSAFSGRADRTFTGIPLPADGFAFGLQFIQ